MEICPPTKEIILINLGWSAGVLVRGEAQNAPGIDTLEKKNQDKQVYLAYLSPSHDPS